MRSKATHDDDTTGPKKVKQHTGKQSKKTQKGATGGGEDVIAKDSVGKWQQTHQQLAEQRH